MFGLRVLAFGIIAVAPVFAAPLTFGGLTVAVNNAGAISSVVFDGKDYFNAGTPVSNWGVMVATSVNTFRLNTVGGGAGVPVSVTEFPDRYEVQGTYTAGGANIRVRRTYALVPGLTVLRIVTVLENLGSTITFNLFETYDPDQDYNAGSFSTYLDSTNRQTGAGPARIFTAAGSVTGYSVVGGTRDPNVRVDTANFQIASGVTLNNIINNPGDSNGAIVDLGGNLATRFVLSAGASYTFQSDLAFGATLLSALSAFDGANPSTEPGAWILMAAGLGTLGVLRRR
ncbi:MAG: hypothetical protein MUC42_04830 [Bryobacter sp.]|nr:hypothetical protein [Bryobacter sp.]